MRLLRHLLKKIITTLYPVLCAFFMFGFQDVCSQTKTEQKADNYFRNYDFDKAINSYKAADRLTADNSRNLAQSYNNRHRYKDAETAYARFIDTEYATTDDYFSYILLLKTNGKHKEVRTWIEKIREKAPDDLRVKNFLETEKDFASWQKNSRFYKIRTLSFNSGEDDFGAAFFGKKIVFTSSRRGNRFFLLREYNWTQTSFVSLFEADVDRYSKQLKKIKLWNKKMNKKWHEGPASFAQNDTLVAFTRNNYSGDNPDDVVRLQIFFSHFRNGEWTEPEPFYLNNPAYSVGHPALSEDGKTMFFVSDKAGGFGGSDIYFVQRNDEGGVWGEAVNAGDKINTEGDEVFPFFDNTYKLLFFASNGLNGLGGLDVFYSLKSTCCFTPARNVGAPVNSPYDDFALIIDKNLKSGYFSSNRPSGKGSDDIYAFTFSGKFAENVPPSAAVVQKTVKDSPKGYTYRLLVLNENTRQPVSKADVKFGELASLTTDSTGMVSKHFTQTVKFRATAEAIGYNPEHLWVSIPSFRDGYVFTDTIYLKVAANRRIVLKNIYYDFDKWDILPESAQELDKLVRFMQDNPDVQVELSSHTDSRGSDEYNLRLSERRAQSAVDYIISKGVSRNKITAKGYGETRPRNNCTNDVPCTEQEHRENRRTEIFISGYGDAEHIRQTKGKF